MSRLRVLELSGSPYEMGYQHGQAYREEIRLFAEERVRLCSDPHWTGNNLSREHVLDLAEACLAKHTRYAPELVEELRGMAAATDLSLAELIIANGFTDFIDVVHATPPAVPPLNHQPLVRFTPLNAGEPHPAESGYTPPLPPPDSEYTPPESGGGCTAFIVPDQATADGQGFFGQTWDMHNTATPYIILLRCRPTDGPASLVFTITGCVGMIGLNDAGIAVGINNLLGGDGQIGVTWPFVVRQILRQTNLEDALNCIMEAKLAGAHNYMLFDKTGRGYNVEAMSSRYQVTELRDDCLVHTNHCLIPRNNEVARPRTAESQASSEARQSMAEQLLSQRPITVENLMELTREPEAICVRATPPLHIETCGAVIARPASGELWAVWGLPSENEYERFTI